MKMWRRRTPETTVSEPEVLVTALYVRDIFALEPDVKINPPRLKPELGAQSPPASEHGGEICQQWASWWQQLLTLPPLALHDPAGAAYIPGLETRPQLRKATGFVFDDAAHWAAQRRQEFGSIVRDGSGASPSLRTVEVLRRFRRRLRSAIPETVRVDVLPVVGQHGWRLSPNRFLVSVPLLRDTSAYGSWLGKEVEARPFGEVAHSYE